MASVPQTGVDRTVSIGRVFSRGFGTIGSNPVATLGISFLFGALPSVLFIYAFQSLQQQSFDEFGVLAGFVSGLVAMVVGLVVYAITQGALVRATVAHSQGRVAGFAESAKAGATVIVPLLLVAVISGLGVVLGLLFLLVPGLMLLCIWAVATPAVVEERSGPLAALSRSSDLTRGARWKIFGLFLVLFVLQWLLAAIYGVLTAAVFSVDLNDPGAGGSTLAFFAMQAVVETVSAAVSGVVLASLYVELRDWKDGPAVETLADVFS